MSGDSRGRMGCGLGFKIVADRARAYLEYRVFDKNKNEIDLKEEKDTSSSSSKKESRSKNNDKEEQ